MERILLLEDLENAQNKTLCCTFDEKIDGIESVGNIHADLTAKSLDEFVQITGHVKGIVTLECDLCLEKFEHKLDFDINELYSKGSLFGDYEESGQEFEIKEGQFVTDLNGAKEINIYDLLYQSVILSFPNKKVCGINCKGKEIFSQENIPDPRLDVFNNINIDLKD